MAATINIPVTLNVAPTALELFGETVDLSGYAYTLTRASGSQVSAAALSAAISYTDLSGDDVTITVAGDLSALSAEFDAIATATYTSDLANSVGGSFGDFYLEYAANEMFGHPLAQAPFSNDGTVVTSVNTPASGYGSQLATALTTAVAKTMFEQLLQQKEDRFDDQSHASAVSVPFQTGDVINFLVTIAAATAVTDGSAASVTAPSSSAAVVPTGLTLAIPEVTIKISTTLA
jgi:hypothetical protein